MEKRARGRPSGGGSKLQRSETVTIRLDPKLRYLAELAARRQRRTVSSFIEWALEHALSNVMLEEGPQGAIDVDSASAFLWDPHEVDRFAKLALYYPNLLTYDEELLWKVIQECDALWREDFNNRRDLSSGEQNAKLLYPVLREHWEALQKVAAGEADISILPQRPGEPPRPLMRLADAPDGNQGKP